jgi:uncharacterized protein
MTKMCNLAIKYSTIGLSLSLLVGGAFGQTAPVVTKLKKILVLDKSQFGANGHMESRRDLINALKELATEKGFTIKIIGQNDAASVISTEFSAENLKTYQAVLFSNNDGVHSQLSSSDKTNFENYIKQGGGFIPIHAASASISNWPWITNMLVESFYDPHGNNQPSINVMHDAEGTKDGTETKGIFKGLTAPLAFLDEYYSFRSSPRGKPAVTILLTIDEKSSNKTVIGAMGSDHPVVWSKTDGLGRVLHMSMGHSWSTNNVYTAKNGYLKNFLFGAMRYVAGDFLGCTDPNHLNYNPDATKNDVPNCVLSPITLSAKTAPHSTSILMNGKSIDVTFMVEGAHDISITDVNGKLIERRKGSGSKSYSLPSPKKSGMYYVHAKSGKNVQSQRITVL